MKLTIRRHTWPVVSLDTKKRAGMDKLIDAILAAKRPDRPLIVLVRRDRSSLN